MTVTGYQKPREIPEPRDSGGQGRDEEQISLAEVTCPIFQVTSHK